MLSGADTGFREGGGGGWLLSTKTGRISAHAQRFFPLYEVWGFSKRMRGDVPDTPRPPPPPPSLDLPCNAYCTIDVSRGTWDGERVYLTELCTLHPSTLPLSFWPRANTSTHPPYPPYCTPSTTLRECQWEEKWRQE